jgi:hypothetical protein
MARPRSQLQRRVVFYGWENIDGMPVFERVRAAQAVNALRGRAWAFVEADFTTAVLVDRPGTATDPTYIRCFRLRSGDEVPHILSSARVPTPLQLQRDESVTDWTHVVIWPDNYAAHDSRRDAPALSRLSGYLDDRANQRVRFFPLYDRSLIDQLEELDEIKAVEIKMRLSQAGQLEEAQRGGLFGGLIDLGRRTEALSISTKISVAQSRRDFLSRNVRQEVQGLAGVAEDFLDNLVVTGVRNGETVLIDVLRRRLESMESVRRSTQLGNAPDPDVMYDAIIRARRTLEASNRLQRAVRVQ